MTDKKPKNYKKTYLYLWLLLAIALGVAVAISLMHDPQFFGLSVKQGTFKEVILAEKDTTEEKDTDIQKATPGQPWETTIAEGAKEEDKTAKAAGGKTGAASSGDGQNYAGYTPKPLSEIESILIFGDSMTILVANRLAQYGKKNGYRVNSVTWDASSTVSWANCDTLDNFIKRYHPDLIMITLGSNELFLKNFEKRRPDVERLLKKIGNIPYLWISPPNWKEDQGYNAFMRGILAPGTFFNSNNLDLPRKKDHIHPTSKGGEIWTDSIMKWIPKSAHPIKAEVPDSGTSSKHNVHYFKAKH